MNGCVISEDSFKSQVKEIHDVSKDLNDNWELCSVENYLYLKKKKKDIVLLDLKDKSGSASDANYTDVLEGRDCFRDSDCEEEIDGACLEGEFNQEKVRV